MVTAANIEYAKGMDSVKKAPTLETFHALGLVEFYTVPHDTNPPFQNIAQRIVNTYSSTLNLFPISNHQAIVVQGSEIELKKQLRFRPT